MRNTAINGRSAKTDNTANAVDIRNLSDDEFLTLGVPTLVYVRKGTSDGQDVFAIHAANGQVVGLTEDPEAAFTAIAEHDMVPMTIH
ncbi:DUF1150 family protein [Acetobacter sacchari]|uniref:DUF1150 family protein n=1 Tax=Acetobacter sacchari TaxID=2661687 RepID=A0ABS3M061_9PROT|nr:DUF1150 family protein [Acetobacter sacchari]MBO1361558.1 DUF1150 family protein [Acetobacter sacchari]